MSESLIDKLKHCPLVYGLETPAALGIIRQHEAVTLQSDTPNFTINPTDHCEDSLHMVNASEISDAEIVQKIGIVAHIPDFKAWDILEELRPYLATRQPVSINYIDTAIFEADNDIPPHQRLIAAKAALNAAQVKYVD